MGFSWKKKAQDKLNRIRQINQACKDTADKLKLSPAEKIAFESECTIQNLNKLAEGNTACEVIGSNYAPKGKMRVDFEETCTNLTFAKLLNEISNFKGKKNHETINKAHKIDVYIGKSPIFDMDLDNSLPFNAEILKLIKEIEEESYNAPDEETRQDFLRFTFKKYVFPLIKNEQFKTWCYSDTPFAEGEFKSNPKEQNLELTFSHLSNDENHELEDVSEILSMTNEHEVGNIFHTSAGKKKTKTEDSIMSFEQKEIKFRGIEIRCPICGSRQMFKRRSDGKYVDLKGFKINEDDEGYLICVNPDCKLEFLFDTNLSEDEFEFANRILKVGHGKWWKVDLSVSGGSRINRSVIGADFLIHRIGGGAAWFEFKRHTEFGFTHDQLIRFRNSVDSKEVATRFIGLLQSHKDKSLNTQLYFWTPAFFRMIPPESFKIIEKAEEGVSKGGQGLILEGLEDFIRNNSLTLGSSQRFFPTSSDIFQKLRKVPNLSLFNVLKGRAFWYGVVYECFDWDIASDILIEKIKSTLKNLDEDIIWKKEHPYVSGEKIIPFRVMAEPIIMRLILNEINNSYRPLYASEIALKIQKDQDLIPFLIWDEGTPYIKSVKEGKAPALFSRSVFQFCEKLVRRDKLNAITHDFSKRRHLVSYFPKKRPNIVLTYMASRSLDLIKEFLERRLKRILQTEGLNLSEIKSLSKFKEICRNQFPITLRTLARELSWDYQALREIIRDRERKELIENNLVHEQLGGPQRRSVLISLTEKGIEYVTRTGQFSVT